MVRVELRIYIDGNLCTSRVCNLRDLTIHVFYENFFSKFD